MFKSTESFTHPKLNSELKAMTRFRSLSTQIILAAYSQHQIPHSIITITIQNLDSKQFISFYPNKKNKSKKFFVAKFSFQIYISGAEGRASLFLKVKAGEVSSGFEYLFDPGRDRNDARPES